MNPLEPGSPAPRAESAEGFFSKDLHPFTLPADGSQRDLFRAYLLANLTYQKIRAVRIAIVYALVAVSGLVWISEGWPGFLPSELSRFAWTSWTIGSLGMLVLAATEWSWYRRRMRCLELLERPPAAASGAH